MADPFGRALRDRYHGRQTAPLWRYDGDTCERHLEQDYYFRDVGEDQWVGDWLKGPVVDVGCGPGDHALQYQERYEVVATDISDQLIELCQERGVRNSLSVDMFDLSTVFERDRFGSALVNGTQLGLGGSISGVSTILREFTTVTTYNAAAVVDMYDPDADAASDLLGYRPDPTPGLANRVFHFEYEDEIGPELHFRLLSPDRLRQACVGTDWMVCGIRYGDQDCYYQARLRTQ